jgi:hypothetical protein
MIRINNLNIFRKWQFYVKKSDGWDMIIRVYSDDHGILFDKTQPAHAHILDLNGNY